MKILHIHERVGDYGGGEIYLASLREGLGLLGHENPAIYLTPTGLEQAADGTHVLRKPHGFWSGIQMAARLDELIDREKPDVIHLHTLFSPVALATVCDKKPVVFTFHSLHLLPRKRSQREWAPVHLYEDCLKPFLRMAMKQLDQIIAPSEAFEKELLKDGFRPEQISVLPHFTEMGSETRGEDDGQTLLFVGRLSADKGILEFIECLARLPKGGWRTLIAGEGPLKDEAVKRTARYGIEKFVQFLGWVDQARLTDAYRQATAVVIPSIVLEAFSLAGIEAMAHWKPVVAFDAGGVHEWLSDGQTGFLVERGNIDALTMRIRTLLEDPALGRKFGEEGRRRVETQYRRKTHLERLMGIYRDALRRRVSG